MIGTGDFGGFMTLETRKEDPYAERLDRVRQRFVSTLEGKIEDAYSAIPKLSAVTPTAALAVEVAYRCMHGIHGVGPTVGFPAAGRAAHDVEDVLRLPQQDKRGLTDDEILILKKSLHALREAVSRELQSLRSAREPQ
jgi:chemotaxis protein histidine kinase CheA